MKSLIYVNVIDFPGGLLTPVAGIHKHGNCYELIEESTDPEHDVWEFTKGDIVTCENIKFAEGEYGLVAKQKCCRTDA